MKIQLPIVAFALSLAMAAASAQSYKWVDKDGKVGYGDTPPPGAKVTTPLKTSPASGAQPAPQAAAGKDAAKDARKGPLTPAEQEQAFRKRKLEDDEARKKQEDALAADLGRKQNCVGAQETVREIESGQRIARTDAKGERYYVDDEQRAKDLAAARRSAADWCGK
jgi:hypothetical protein